ncbi:MAG: helix-turn-helix transcriptional regulator [Chloroflexi bacterium]|nr:helix-turn-helix transcriptional regulator [Chloroflexota bacterium]
MTNNNNGQNLGRILKQRRLMMPLTLRELAVMSGISSSHLGRIERRERFPSAAVLRKLAKPLGFEESELFSLAGYLSPPSAGIEERETAYSGKQLDPYVSQMLSQEPLEVQRAAIGILSILRSIATALAREQK